jgi:hypothetical protein
VTINFKSLFFLNALLSYGFHNWDLVLREEKRLELPMIRLLTKIFGHRMDEGKGNWRRLHSKELHDLYFSLNIRVIKSRRII